MTLQTLCGRLLCMLRPDYFGEIDAHELLGFFSV